MRETHRLDLLNRQMQEIRAAKGPWRNVELLGDVHLFFEATEAATARDFAFRLDVSDYDVLPPELHVVDHRSRRILDERSDWPSVAGFIHNDRHPTLKRWWRCQPALREFHLHVSHVHDPWDNYRYRYTLLRYLEDITEALRRPLPKQAASKPSRFFGGGR